MNTATQSRAVNNRADSGLADLVDEVIRRFQAGESIDPDALAGHDPERADHLRRLLPTLEKLADLVRSATAERTGGPPASSDPGPRLGVLGDYHLLREVGRGGMGIVYEAMQLSLHRRVALKVLPFAAVTDPKQLQRFHVEAQAAAQLHHTNIVPVHAVGCERGVHYYAMQFIEGDTLARVIEELRDIDGQGMDAPGNSKGVAFALASGLASGRLDPTEPGPDTGELTAAGPPPAPPTPTRAQVPSSGSSTRSRAFFQNAARLGIQAAEALEHAHQQGVLHRDIKPSNLLIDLHGNLWITDFGLARLQSEASLTMTGDLMGTLRYMSPEQAMAKRVIIDHRTDIYSLGATLYEMLTLHAVFEEDDRQALLRQIAFAEPRPLRKLNLSIPRELETIVLKALVKDPESRYATAQELADDLRRFLEDKPIRARRPTIAERAVKWSRRHPAVVWSALAILVLAVVGLSAGLVLLNAERNRTERERDRVARVAEDLRRKDYIQRVNLALREIQDDGNVVLAESLLDGCPAVLRGWEWDYVRRQAHLDHLTYRGHLLRLPNAANRPNRSRHADGFRITPSVNCVAVSPDGKWAASGTGVPYDLAHDYDRAEIRLWDVETGRERQKFDDLIGTVQAVAISPDGKLLAAAGGYYEPKLVGWLMLWDVTTGKPRPLPFGNVSGMTGTSVAFSPDGQSLAVGYGFAQGGGRSGQLTLIELATGETWTPQRPHDFGIGGLAFSSDPDRPRLAAFGWRGVEVWDWKNRTLAGQLPLDPHGISGHYWLIMSVAFSRDGQRIATGGVDKTVRLWDPATGKEPRTLYGHKAFVVGVAFSPDGTRLASVGEDRSVRLWEVATGRELANFHGHTFHIFAVAFHPDGRQILSGGSDGVVKVWDVQRSRPVVYEKQPWWVTGTAFRPDGRLVATESDRWRTHLEAGRTTEELRELRKTLKVDTRFWDPETGEEVQPPSTPGADPAFGAFNRLADRTVTSPDGRRIAKVDKDDAPNDVRVIDAASGRVVFTLVGHTHAVTSIAFSPDSQRIATASLDRTVKLWDAETGQEVLTLRDHTASVLCVAFSPDGHRLVSGSIDRTARIWDARPLNPDSTRDADEPPASEN